jgi:oligopeptide transport system ATP-binding protein
MSEPLLKVEGLTKHFLIRVGIGKHASVRAVDDLSFHINRGETLGLVGESGCGKSTTGRTILHLYEPTAGTITFDGQPVTKATIGKLRRRMQIVFQDPYSSLNPRMTVGDIIAEPLDIQKTYTTAAERQDVILRQLQLVGLTTDHMNRYPHEFSGGQRQRISIARALSIRQDFIVCDEPVSALDVSIQAQVINMLMELQQQLGLTYLFIAHDLAVVRHISSRIGVMYLGKLVELCDSHELYRNPLHPYTHALLSAIPVPDPNVSRERKRVLLEGDVPSPIDPPSGCRFRTRCPMVKDICAEQEPPLVEVSPGHNCACHLRV